MAYQLSERKLRSSMTAKGWRSLSDFARHARLNRNTIHAYLRGKPVFSRQFMRIADALGQDPVALLGNAPSAPVETLPPGIRTVADEIARMTKGVCVVLFGSRTGPSHNAFADWDLGIGSARSRIGASAYLRLKSLVEERAENMPWSVDLVNLDNAPEWFMAGMERAPLFLGGSSLAFARLIARWEAAHERTET